MCATTPGSTRPARGRPRDDELTARLVAAAADVVDQHGLAALTAARLVARTGAGKAAVYRRWPDMDALAAHLLLGCTPPAIPDAPGPSLRADLQRLLEPWQAQPSRAERVVAGLLSSTRTHPGLRAALDAALLRPLEAAVAGILAAHVDDDPARLARTLTVVRGLWWERFLFGTGAAPRPPVDDLVDHVLLPAALGPAS